MRRVPANHLLKTHIILTNINIMQATSKNLQTKKEKKYAKQKIKLRHIIK
jgi:hypothetical protein